MRPDKQVNLKAPFSIRKSALKSLPLSVSAGNDHVGVLTQGKLFMWGSNRSFQLGQPLPEQYDTWVELRLLKPLPLFDTLHCVENATLLSSEEGVWAMGSRASALVPVPETQQQVKELVPMTFPEKVILIQTSAAEHHCLCLDIQGRVFAWGSNQFRQISSGLDPKTLVMTPTIIRDCSFESMGWVCATHTASFCLDTGGRAFVWGCPFQGQASAIHTRHGESLARLTEVTAEAPFEAKRFKRIFGVAHKFGLVSFQNELFVFGLNSATNFLGLTQSQQNSHPSMTLEKPLRLELDQLDFIDGTFCEDFSLILCQPSDIISPPTNNKFRAQVLRISQQRCQVLRSLRTVKHRNKKELPLSSQAFIKKNMLSKHFILKEGPRPKSRDLTLDILQTNSQNTEAVKGNISQYLDKRDFPVVKGCENLVSQSLSTSKKKNNLSVLDDDYSQSTMSHFQRATLPLQRSAKEQLQSLLGAVDKSTLVFGDRRHRGATNAVEVNVPADLLNVSSQNLPNEYMSFVTSGREQELISHVLAEHKPSLNKKNMGAILNMVKVEINSKNINVCYKIYNKMTKGIKQVEEKRLDIKDRVKVVAKGLKACRDQAEKHIHIKAEHQLLYKRAMSPRAKQHIPTLTDRVEKLRKEEINYSHRLEEVMHTKAIKAEIKMARTKELLLLIKPQNDAEEVKQLKVVPSLLGNCSA